MKTSVLHYVEHRKRVKERFLKNGLQTFQDYEVLEFILTFAIHRKDVKPVAKDLIAKFNTFQGVLEASVDELTTVDGIGTHAAILLKLMRECSDYYLRFTLHKKNIIASPDDLIQYCRSSMAYRGNEQFRVIYLNAKNEMLKDEVIQEGTIDQTTVYPRKIIEHALREKAVALIFVHNHPSGNPEPSSHDKDLTYTLMKAAETFSIKIHDHIIIGINGYCSLKEEGMMA